MSKHHSFVDTIHQVATTAIDKGIAHLFTEDSRLTNNEIHLKGKKVINFGSCSYLGLEFNRQMKQGAQEAIENYGTQFAESRSYVSVQYYEVLEKLLTQIFNAPTIVSPTTTLGHIACIPVLINDEDAVVLDHQVHFSVQTAVNLVKPRGVHVEMIRHNRIDMLEERIKVLRQKHPRIWYMGDGIYSMYGDGAAIKEIYQLLNQYPELHYYADDAHGMSCFGKHGCGYILSRQSIHPKMVMATSLNKAFASGGGALIFPNQELAGKVRKCGSSFITSGPLQPAQLGAGIAAAKIHLSDEIHSLQDDLHENIRFANLLLKKYNLPLVAETDSSVFFVGVGLPKLGYNLVKRMLDEGYYVNLGIFPAVPIKNTGIRFTITRLHSFEQIENMIAAMAYHFPLALQEEGMTMEQIYHAFKLPTPEEKQMEAQITSLINQTQLQIEHHTTILNVDKETWNNLLGNRGTFDWDGLKFLEESFSGNEKPEDNWEFDYLLMKDSTNKTVLATFLTTALSKDDMLSPAAVSDQVEQIRKGDHPYYLTSKVLSIGSLLTEGEHLYIDKTSPLWKAALQLLLEKMTALQEQYKVHATLLRDFNTPDSERDTFLMENGFFKVALPDNHHIDLTSWNNKEEYLKTLSSGSRQNFKRYIQRYEDKYEVRIVPQPTEEELQYFYQLYLNVKRKSREVNTFALPYKLFKNMASHPQWEILVLQLKDEMDARPEKKPLAVVFSYVTQTAYNFMVIGIDYDFLEEYKCYKQALYRLVMRAKELKLELVNLGFTTSFEKRKMGAKIVPTIAYMQTKDNFSMAVLGTMNAVERVKN